MNSGRTIIEKLRRRAKDNKAKNTRYFLSLSFTTLDKLRNLLITLSAIAFGFFQSGVVAQSSGPTVLSSLLYSVIFGMLNYATSWLAVMYEANYNSKIESIFSEQAYPTQVEYEKMINNENLERLKKKNIWWPAGMLFLVLQSIFLIIALKNAI